MNTNKLNFSFKSSIFAFKNNSKIEIENNKIIANYPNIKFGILQDRNKDFEIERENIFSMGFSFSNIIFLVIGITITCIGYLQLDNIYYQEEYGIYATIGFLLGFFGGTYMYDNMIKPKKKLEEVTLSIEFLIRGVCIVIAIILVLLSLFKVGFSAIFIGILGAVGILFILASFSLHFQIVDKNGFAYRFPVLFWQFAEVNRIFRANFHDFFKEKVIKVSEENSMRYQENTSTEINTENKVYSRKNKNSDKFLLIGLLVGAVITTLISYFLPLESGSYPATFVKMMEELADRSGREIGVFAFILPFIIIVALGLITFFKEISGNIKIFANILSGVILSILFGIAFFPFHYLNMFTGHLSASQIKTASNEMVFGLWNILLLVAMICMVIYTFKINSKK